jgi:hypothetical protein
MTLKANFEPYHFLQFSKAWLFSHTSAVCSTKRYTLENLCVAQELSHITDCRLTQITQNIKVAAPSGARYWVKRQGRKGIYSTVDKHSHPDSGDATNHMTEDITDIMATASYFPCSEPLGWAVNLEKKRLDNERASVPLFSLHNLLRLQRRPCTKTPFRMSRHSEETIIVDLPQSATRVAILLVRHNRLNQSLPFRLVGSTSVLSLMPNLSAASVLRRRLPVLSA